MKPERLFMRGKNMNKVNIYGFPDQKAAELKEILTRAGLKAETPHPQDEMDPLCPLIISPDGPYYREFLQKKPGKNGTPVLVLFTQKDYRVPENFSEKDLILFLPEEAPEASLISSIRLLMALKQKKDILSRQAEELKTANRLLDMFVHSNRDSIIIVDKNFRIVDANDATVSMFGYTRDEIIGGVPWRMSPSNQSDGADSGDKAIAMLKKAWKTGFNSFEWIHTKADGTVFNAEVNLRRIDLESGSYVQGIITDISDKKRIEAQLKESEQRLETLLENLPLEIWITDEKGRYILQNSLHRKHLGYQIGKTYQEVLSERTLHLDWLENYRRVYSGETVVSNREFIEDSRYVCLQEILSPILDGKTLKGCMGIILDITENMNTKRKLREREDFLSGLLEESPIGIIISNQLTKEIYSVNKAMTKMTGYTKEDIPDGPSWWQKAYPDPEYRKIVKEGFNKNFFGSVETGKPPESQEALVRCKNGNSLWVRGYYALRENYAISYFMDYTTLKNAELSLKNYQKRLTDLLEFLPDPTFALDRNGMVIFWNKAMAGFTGVAAKEVIGRGNGQHALCFYGKKQLMLSDLIIHPEERALNTSPDIINNGECLILEGTKTIRTKQTADIWAKACPLYDENGDITGAIETIRDITEKKTQERLLAESELKYRTIFEGMPIGFSRAKTDGTIIEVNPAFLKIFGFKDYDDFINYSGGKAQVFYQSTEDREMILKDIAERKDSAQFKTLVKRKDGTVFPIQAIFRYIKDPSGDTKIIECLMEDISERERLQEIMVESEKLLTIAGMAAGMAHEINNPLGIITQTAENLKRRLSEDISANKEAADSAGFDLSQLKKYIEARGIDQYISDIHAAAIKAAKIISNMLQFSRNKESSSLPFDINIILDKAINLAYSDYSLKNQYDFKKIKIIKKYNPLPEVICSETQIEQVLLNILKNAAQAMGEMGLGRRVPKIEISTSLKNSGVTIEIADNGPGMDKELEKHIFQPFFTTKEKGIGSGLGLSVSYHIIVNIHHGKISLKSEKGRGTKFTIWLPINKDGKE